MSAILRLDPYDSATAGHIAAVWNAATTTALAISPRTVLLNTRANEGIERAAFANADSAVLLSVARDMSQLRPSNPQAQGWLELIAVHPAAQRRGIGSALMQTARDWFRERGCASVLLGMGLRPFVSGLPIELGTREFFERHGFVASDRVVCDVGADLTAIPRPQREGQGVGQTARQATASDIPALREFFARAFIGRWQYEFEMHLADGGALSDYIIAQVGARVEAFCQITFEDSLRPIERFHPVPLPCPWGQMGPIGVSAETRGMGLARAVMLRGFDVLRARGVRGCIIDWTDLIEFYRKFGFEPHRQYTQMELRVDLRS
jgi:predicted N-acetyltransferase YhbS